MLNSWRYQALSPPIPNRDARLRGKVNYVLPVARASTPVQTRSGRGVPTGILKSYRDGELLPHILCPVAIGFGWYGRMGRQREGAEEPHKHCSGPTRTNQPKLLNSVQQRLRTRRSGVRISQGAPFILLLRRKLGAILPESVNPAESHCAQNCAHPGAKWPLELYQPRFSGGNETYVVVNQP